MIRKRMRYAQNFLKDTQLIRILVGKSSINRQDSVFEIGFGQGLLTRQLALRAGHVTAVEVDPVLKSTVGNSLLTFASNITVECADVELIGIPLHCNKVFANIPFNRTARIVRMIYEAKNITEAFLVMQTEAAAKYSGEPRETEASLLVKPRFAFQVLHRFNRNDFEPMPNVDVVLLRIAKREECLFTSSDNEAFRSFVRFGFRSTKPALRLTFKKVFTHEQWKRLSEEMRFSREASPTMLSFDQWRGLFGQFLARVSEPKRRLILGSDSELNGDQQ